MSTQPQLKMSELPWNHLAFVDKVKGVQQYISGSSQSQLQANWPYYNLLYCNLVKEMPHTWRLTAREIAERSAGCDVGEVMLAIIKDMNEHHSFDDRVISLKALQKLGDQLLTARTAVDERALPKSKP